MRSERLYRGLIAALSITAIVATADAANTSASDFIPIETVVSADCWGQWPDDIIASVRDCKPADAGNRLRVQVIADEDGPARVGLDEQCRASRCAPLQQLLHAAPTRRLLLQTPATLIDAVVATVNAAHAQSRVAVEPLLQRPQHSSAPIVLANGVHYWRQRLDGAAPVMLHIAEIELDTPGLELVGTRGQRGGGGEFSARTTSGFVRDEHLILAINTDYFLPFNGGHLLDQAFTPSSGQTVTAEGLAITNGNTVSAAPTQDRRVNAAFCVDAAGHARIVSGGCPSATRLGIGAGPLLLLNGHRQPREPSRADYYQQPQPRSAIGLDRSHRRLWLIVADGRQPGYSEGMSLDALSEVFEKLGAETAMNLDGGGSSTLAARIEGRVRALNSPIHTGIPGRERAVANHLGIRLHTP